MKIIFKKPSKEALFIKINPKNKDEIIKESGVKTLYLKCEEKMTLRKLFLLVRKMVQLAKGAKVERIAFDLNDFYFKEIKMSDREIAEIIGTQLDLANYEFTLYKSKIESTFIREVFVTGGNKETEKSLLKGHAIAEEVNKTRTLSNTPGGDMTPTVLAQKAKESVRGLPVKVTVLGEKEMAKQKMRAILSVGRGSDEESKFIIMEYHGGPKNEKPIVLVGKGVTFDSGGVNLKPGFGLFDMQMDMSGGASVIHTIALVAKNKLKKNVVGLIPSVENMMSGKSYRPRDVIYSMSGQTIEILNTDAEGRVILADALTYAQQYKPELVIDIATLTTSSMVALGEKASALLTNEDKLANIFREIGERTGEYSWQFPLWEEYEEDIKGKLGDWTNLHNKDSRYGDVIYSSTFLHQFIKGCKWLHIDIAPKMVSTPADLLAPGALGTPVRTLFKFIEEYSFR